MAESVIIESEFERDVRQILTELKQDTEELKQGNGSPPIIG